MTTIRAVSTLPHVDVEAPATTDQALRQARKDLLRDLAQAPDRPAAAFLSRYLLTLVPLTLAGGALAAWPRPVSFILCAVVAGFTQNALGVLMHEGSHHFFHRHRQRNDLLANVLVCLPIFNTVEGYRREHFEHHRHSGEPSDPYHDLYGQYRTKKDLIAGLVADLIGLTAIRSFLKRYAGHERPVDGGAWWTLPAILIEQAALGGLLWWLTGSPFAWLFLWILPLVTIPIAINRMRTVVEHSPGFDALPANRTTLVGLVEYFCIAPYGYSHHFEHHFAPNVPYYRLAWAHGYLKDRGITLRSHEVNGDGYLRTFGRVMSQLPVRSHLAR